MIKSNGMSCFHLIVWYFLLLKRLKTLFHDVLGFPGGSNGKESACSVADPASVPGSQSSPGKGNEWQAYLVAQVAKESTCHVGDLSSIPGLGISPGGGHGNPLQDSCLENPTDRGVWWATVHGVTKSWILLSN